MPLETFLSINNNEEVMQFPVPIEPFQISSPFNNDSFDGMKQELNLIGLRGLQTFQLTSYFPVHDYPFLQNRSMWGMDYVKTIERWRDRRFPLRLIISGEDPQDFNLNEAVTIEELTYGPTNNGDISFTISFRLFPFVRV